MTPEQRQKAIEVGRKAARDRLYLYPHDEAVVDAAITYEIDALIDAGMLCSHDLEAIQYQAWIAGSYGVDLDDAVRRVNAVWRAALSGSTPTRAYDSDFGDERICECGHEYRRHFDTYDDMRPIGCKYCPCGVWSAPTRTETP